MFAQKNTENHEIHKNSKVLLLLKLLPEFENISGMCF